MKKIAVTFHTTVATAYLCHAETEAQAVEIAIALRDRGAEPDDTDRRTERIDTREVDSHVLNIKS